MYVDYSISPAAAFSYLASEQKAAIHSKAAAARLIKLF